MAYLRKSGQGADVRHQQGPRELLLEDLMYTKLLEVHQCVELEFESFQNSTTNFSTIKTGTILSG